MFRPLLVLTVTSLMACGGGEKSSTASSPPDTPVVPDDPVLADLYASTCQSCHGSGIGNAPLAGDTVAWQPRLAQGMDTLLTHTIDGYRGMPPLGSCSDCSEEEFRALIRFMSSAPADTIAQETTR